LTRSTLRRRHLQNEPASQDGDRRTLTVEITATAEIPRERFKKPER